MPPLSSSRAVAVIVCAALAAACSGGGNSRPPTVVTGNVRSVSATASLPKSRSLWRVVRAWWSGEAVAQVPGVTVAIENTGDATATDDQGFFRLEGEKVGPSTLLFGAPAVSARLAVILPAGGELDLIDIDVVANQIRVGQQRIQFEGPVTGVDCSANLLQVLSGSLVPFRVLLVTGTVITDEDGAPLRCVDLVNGSAQVAGTVDDDGDVTALSVRVNPLPAGTSTNADEVHGAVAALHCPTELTVAASGGDVVVNLTAGTTIKDANATSIDCSDLHVGDAVSARGTLGTFGLAASEVDRTAPAMTPTPATTPTPGP